MKKTIWFALTALLGLSACNKNEQVATDEFRTVSIRASIGSTRADYSPAGAFSWTAGDAIDVLYTDGDYQIYTLTTEESGSMVSFTGTVSGTEGGNYQMLAVYPSGLLGGIWGGDQREGYSVVVPAEVEGSGASYVPMIAAVSKDSFTGVYEFRHISAVFRFDVKNIPAEAAYFKVTSHDNGIADIYWPSWDDNGQVYITWANDHSNNLKTYHFSPNADGTFSFYLPFGCIQPWNNFSFAFADADGNDLCTRTPTTLGSYAQQTLERNKLYVVSLDASKFTQVSGGGGSGSGGEGGDPSVQIIINGDYSDWDAIQPLASCTNGDSFTAIKALKVAADDDNVYFYWEVDKALLDQYTSPEAAGDTYGWGAPLRIYLGDGVNGNNCGGWPWADGQMFVSNDQRPQMVNGAPVFDGVSGGVSGNVIRFEWGTPRSDTVFARGTFYVGLYMQDNLNGWQDVGIIPQAWGPMLEVVLP